MENSNSWIIPINLTELAPTVAITLIIAILFYLSRNEISGLFNKFFEFKSKNYELRISELEKDIVFLKEIDLKKDQLIEKLESKIELLISKNEALETKQNILEKQNIELSTKYQNLLSNFNKQGQHLTEIDNKIS